MTAPPSDTLQSALLRWYRQHRRDLPWRRNADPYAVWISEVMLQQTRVAAAVPFFERFLLRFPDVVSLANAPEADLLAHWAGLGYYYRARNLQKAAQAILLAGEFPDTFEAIGALPGVGPYTAAAVSSIAFNLPHAVVDGNVYRVLSRLFNDSTNIASSRARSHFTALASTLLDMQAPGEFNQAMMELGATVCLPKQPQCLLCPVRSYCAAQHAGTQQALPVKLKPQKSVTEERKLFWVAHGGHVLGWQRPPSSRLMPGFWELPEGPQLEHVKPIRKVAVFRHGITIYKYRFELWEAELLQPAETGPCRWLSTSELQTVPVSTIFRKALSARAKTETQALSASI